MAGTERNLRRAGIVAVLVAIVGCIAAAGATAAPLVITGNFDGESVSAIDTQTNQTVGGPISLGAKAWEIAIVPGGSAYIVEGEADAVAAVDPTTRKLVKAIPVGELPESLAVSPDGKTVYVVNHNSEDVSIIDTATNTSPPGSIPVGGEPYAIAFAPNGKFAYVGVDETLVTIDTTKEGVVGTPIPIGNGAHVIAFAPDGATAYVSEEAPPAVAIISTTLHKEVGAIPMPGANPWGVAVSPDGKRLYVADHKAGTVTAFSTATEEPIGTPIEVGELPYELAFTPDGKKLYVADYQSNDVTPIDPTTNKALAPIQLPGLGVWQLAITPDLSPTAAFTVTGITADYSATFDGSASSDPDGTVKHWAWEFGDGFAASGVSTNLGTSATGFSATHTYRAPGIYPAALTVLDNEGCGVETIFTGRTAYCSGNPLAKVIHPVQVAPPPPGPTCSTNFALGGVSHNRKNGTVRLRLRFYSTGSFLVFGKKIHAVTRKVRKPGVAVVTLHARVELNKRLKKTLRAGVRYRVTFTPGAGCGSKTVHRSVALLRAPRKKHHR
jgi:YVTN family beta-propeller protein